MFHIIKSNRMEILMQGLLSVLAQVPDSPLMPEWISVQSRGMKQWISLQMAGQQGICAHTRFVFPRQLVDELLQHFAPFENQDENLDRDFFFWSAVKLIRENRREKALSHIDAYIRDDGTNRKLVQVSKKIAELFDDYQVYRPDLLLDWQKGRVKAGMKDPAALWQAFVWQKMVSGCPDRHLAWKADAFVQGFTPEKFNMEGLPSRICLFGISSLPDLFLQIFEKVSASMDIYLFLLTPSNRFFLDIRPEREIEKILLGKNGLSDPADLYYETGNPLLSSLGTAGKVFHTGLEAFHYNEPFEDLFIDPVTESKTVLTVLQSDILNLFHRKGQGETPPLEVDPRDTSVGIHACHSPMREAQALKDLLLDEFETDPDLAPHDIIIMMPDIEAYAPFIESVFSLETPLPFTVSDRKKRSESEPLDAFLKILALQGTRFEKTRVLDLLRSESIAQKFCISLDDMAGIEQMAGDAGILWARDKDHRQDLGFPPFEENTWQFGFRRLFMGMAMPEGHDALVQGILPCESFEGLELEVLGKFSAFCHALFSGLSRLDGQKPVGAWCRLLKQLAVSLLDLPAEAGEDFSFLMEILDRMEKGAGRAGFSEPVSFDTIHTLVSQKLDLNISQGNFMSGNITVCNIMPMRSIPFKVIVLMGMDEKSFPGPVFSPGFDLMKKYPRPGDKNKRNEDRYLFLETLLSARKKMIITYTGMDIADNSSLPCAGVVSELAEALDQGFIYPEGVTYRFFHPLHAHDAAYFNSFGPLFSYSKSLCRMARIKKKEHRPWFVRGRYPDLPTDITLEDMIRFFRNPVEEYLKQGLNLFLHLPEEEKEDREVFTVSGLDQYHLGSLLLEKQSSGPHEKDLYPFFRAMGSLPPGKKGRLVYDSLMTLARPLIRTIKAGASLEPLPAFSGEVRPAGLKITGRLNDIREDGAHVISFGRLNSHRLLSAWIRHLFLNAAAPPGCLKQTLVSGQDPKRIKPVLTCMFPDLGERAALYLEELAGIYRQGVTAPFYFFCETSFQFARALSGDGYALTDQALAKAMGRAKKFWHDPYQGTGEKQNRYIALCIDPNDPFESVETLVSSGFVQNAIQVFKPLLDNLRQVS